MSVDAGQNVGLEIGHVLFIDIVGYSKRLINEQTALVQRLSRLVRASQQFRKADANGELITIPTGDGMALVFFTTPDAPVRCAIEINKADQEDPKIELRMGIHSGPVDRVADVTQRINVAGTGINTAQRVMDVGDAGHILLSKRSADDLAQYDEWKRQLHDLGEVEAKHGVRLGVVNLYNDGIGNPARPSKVTQAEQVRQDAIKAVSQRKRRRTAMITGSLIVILLGIAVGTWAWHRRAALTSAYKAGLTQIVEKSIAVLPFENFDPDKESSYFADGVQDDILTDLARIADLKVIGRRSVAQYRDTKQNAREIGQALQVAYLLEGSVRRLGGRITVTAHLIDTRNELEKWAQRYDQDLSDLFKIQNQISESIVTQLKAVITPEEKAAIEAPPTQNMEAYDLYLRARAIFHATGTLPKDREETWPMARKYLDEAIKKDPKFVLAWCLLSEVLPTPEFPLDPTPEQIAAGKAAAETAVKLAPDSGDAHIALGDIYYNYLKDRARAVEEYKIAARSMPNSPILHATLGTVAVDRGEWKEALQHLQRAAQIDPRDTDIAHGAIEFYTSLRWYNEAEALSDRIIGTLPPEATRQFWADKYYIALGRGDLNAMNDAQEGYYPNGRSNTWHQRQANWLMMEGRYAEAVDLIDRLPDLTRKFWPKNWSQEGLGPFVRASAALIKAEALRAQGDMIKARATFEESRKDFVEWLAKHPDQPDNPGVLTLIALTDAGLGRNDQAVTEAEKVMQAWPMSRNPGSAVGARNDAAVVYAWTGNRDASIRLLQEIVKIPGGVSSGELKLHPNWNELRNDSRFAKIVEEAAKPIKFD